MALDGPIKGHGFAADTRQVLAPTLRPGDVVIMDNLSGHKRASVWEMTEGAGARMLFRPPFSPDCNPIEMAFAVLKAPLKRAVTRTLDDRWNAIGAWLTGSRRSNARPISRPRVVCRLIGKRSNPVNGQRAQGRAGVLQPFRRVIHRRSDANAPRGGPGRGSHRLWRLAHLSASAPEPKSGRDVLCGDAQAGARRSLSPCCATGQGAAGGAGIRAISVHI